MKTFLRVVNFLMTDSGEKPTRSDVFLVAFCMVVFLVTTFLVLEVAFIPDSSGALAPPPY